MTWRKVDEDSWRPFSKSHDGVSSDLHCGQEVDKRAVLSPLPLPVVGRLEEAEQLTLQVLEAQKKIHKKDHPANLQFAYGLVHVHKGQGRLEEAEQLLLWVLEVQRRSQGELHPHTLKSTYSLAQIWKSLSRTEEAISLMRECASLRRQVLGADHRRTQYSFRTLEKWEWEYYQVG